MVPDEDYSNEILLSIPHRTFNLEGTRNNFNCFNLHIHV